MLHPVTMLLLFGTSVYAGTLGLKWRQQREIGEQLKDLNKQLPVLSTGKASSPLAGVASKIKAELVGLQGSEDNDTPLRVATLEGDLKLVLAATELDAKIGELQATRKELIGANLKVYYEEEFNINQLSNIFALVM